MGCTGYSPRITGAPVAFALGCVVFSAANMKFKALSDPVPGKTEQESDDCLGVLSAEVVVNKESEAKRVVTVSMMMDGRCEALKKLKRPMIQHTRYAGCRVKASIPSHLYRRLIR